MGADQREGDRRVMRGEQEPISRPGSAEQARGTGQADGAEMPRRKRGIARKLVLSLVLLAALGAGGHFAWTWWTEGRFMVETDDAYVHVDFAVMAPKVTGYVSDVLVKEYQPVKAGDVLAVVDGIDYRAKLEEIEAKIAAQQATVARLDEEEAAAATGIAQARAQTDAARANLSAAISDYDRYRKLAATSTASAQKLDAAKAARDSGYAAVREGEAGIAAAEARQNVAAAEKAEAVAAIQTLEAERHMAMNDLDATILRAPYDGVVGNLSVVQGDYVTPGKRLMAVIPLDAVYVDANFKETQIAELTPGTEVHLTVDAFPDRDVVGHVVGLAPASGAVFSLLPPENATGNFTKIVQRFPVRVSIPADVAAEGWLRPGMSVIAKADIRTAGNEQALARAGH